MGAVVGDINKINVDFLTQEFDSKGPQVCMSTKNVPFLSSMHPESPQT